MKMNKIYKLAALVLGASVLATGCMQETEPMNGSATSGQIAESPFAADGMIASIPAILITNNVYGQDAHDDFGYPSMFATFDRAIGEIFPANWYSGGNQYYDRFQYYHYQMNIGPTGYCSLVWYHYYQFIKATNDLISVAKGSEMLKEQCGVAKTFRALYYLDLARFYDPLYAVSTERPSYMTELEPVKGLTVPVIDENTTEELAKNNPRLPRGEMFQFIFNDLNDAEEGLASYVPASKNLPTLAVVYGLKARAYLWLGGFQESDFLEGDYDTTKYPDVLIGNEAYAKAAEYARKAITASGCKPLTEAEYCDPINGFNNATANNSWMWAMIQSSETVLSNLHTWAAHMCSGAGWGYGCGAQPGVRKASYERMSNTDFRKKLIIGPNSTYADYKDVTNLTEAEWKEWGLEGNGMYTYAHMKFRTNGGEKQNSSTGNVVDIPMMRVEEMYLIEAEASEHVAPGSGKALIASFMTAYRDPKYTVPAGADVVEEIIFQKRCELWGEGVLFFDFKRLDMGIDNAYEGSNTPGGLDFSTSGRCPAWNICIPQAETQQNAALDGKNNPDPSKTLKAKSEAQ